MHRDGGLSAEAGLVDLGLRTGMLSQRGGWVSYGTVRLGQGRQAARGYLRDHPKLARQLDHDLRTQLATISNQPAAAPAAF